jgi:hypothetical protein
MSPAATRSRSTCAGHTAKIGATTLQEGDVITIDGTTGNVYAGRIATVEAQFFGELATLLAWADEVARLEVMANADTPRDAARAREYGAMGIGLCRTERMFNDSQRLPIVQDMILADTLAERRVALDKLLPIQRADFKGIFQAMAGLPVTVRCSIRRCTSSCRPPAARVRDRPVAEPAAGSPLRGRAPGTLKLSTRSFRATTSRAWVSCRRASPSTGRPARRRGARVARGAAAESAHAVRR